jgi:hypothetical protein
MIIQGRVEIFSEWVDGGDAPYAWPGGGRPEEKPKEEENEEEEEFFSEEDFEI